MPLLTCCFWWLVLGALVGWLFSWLFDRLFGRTEVREIAGATPVAASSAPIPAAPSVRVDDRGPGSSAGNRSIELQAYFSF